MICRSPGNVSVHGSTAALTIGVRANSDTVLYVNRDSLRVCDEPRDSVAAPFGTLWGAR